MAHRSFRPARSLVVLPASFLLFAIACGGSDESNGTGPNAAGAAGATSGGTAGTSATKGGSAGATGNTGGAAGAISTGKGGAGGNGATAGSAGAGAGNTSGGTAGSTTGGSAGAAGSTVTGGNGGAAGETQAQFCAGKGPPILVGDDGKQICAGALAATTFRFGLCTCEGYVSSGKLTTDGFDSTKGAYVPGQNDGSVGTNAKLNASNDLVIGGSLWVSSKDGITVSSNVTVGGDLQCGGEYTTTQNLKVGDDASVNGKIIGKDLTVVDVLTQPAGAQLLVSGTKTIGSTKAAPVNVPDPCDCSPDLLVDIAGYVKVRQNDNDNASVPLAKDATTNLSADKTIDLPCGRYYLDELTGAGRVTFNAKGRVALFLGGNISTSKGFAVTLEPGAELDLFIAGNVVSSGTINLGDPAHPANVRVYVGGSGTISLSGGGVFTGNVYAPKAEIVLAANTEFYGSVFARRVSTSGDVTIHYDTAILKAGKDCPPPGGGGAGGGAGSGGGAGAGGGTAGTGGTTAGTGGSPPADGCKSCRDCQNQACNAGVCGACESDSDCCAPLQCSNGVCLPQIK